VPEASVVGVWAGAVTFSGLCWRRNRFHVSRV
jgi:hypothetical protein